MNDGLVGGFFLSYFVKKLDELNLRDIMVGSLTRVKVGSSGPVDVWF